ncbi:hypothetical protein RDWZM_010407 [Blomia tropicalis]|uniref:Uncharacterized protein n=1 Tax=Blomia tropicalis TaxID=40697 RepID=A0A9Q0M0Y6_BLOTA|nr:hypothetical protein RDWZM_010407 [Blomia tropicalis]
MPSSVHSYGARSTTSIATTRSRTLAGSRKVKLKWWERRPILPNAFFIDLQKGSYLSSIFSLLESILQITLAIFDIYCLVEAAPGSKHFRSFGISFMFVYSGNPHVRRALIASGFILVLCSIYLLTTALVLMTALRKEHELKFRHWLRSMAIFIVARFATLFFQSIVNDLYFAYHQIMLLLWLAFLTIDVFAWLVVYSNYQELSDITRLEDMAKLKMSTLSSLNASRSFSHHSLDSANPYGRYGGGTSSLQPSPQIYSHHHHPSANVPMSIHESHQNLPSVSQITPQIHHQYQTHHHQQPQQQQQSAPNAKMHHSSQNSLHQSYLQMYSNTLSQRSRQSSAQSLQLSSVPAANHFPMQSYTTPSNAPI